MIVYVVLGNYNSDKYKPINNEMLGYMPVFESNLAAKEYALKGNYPVIRVDTNNKKTN